MLDIAVTPDRAYALSIRGIAREAATAYGVAFRDPADLDALPADDGEPGHPVQIADPTAADRIVLRTVTGLDPAAPTPGCGCSAGCVHVRHAAGLARRRRHQLRDARARPAAARVRPRPAAGADRRPPRGAGGAARDARPRDAATLRPRGRAHRRRPRADRAGRHDGRPGDRDRRGLDRPGDRGGALPAGADRADGPAAQAAERGVAAVRARRRPRAAAGRVGAGGRAARRARRGDVRRARARSTCPASDRDDRAGPGAAGRAPPACRSPPDVVRAEPARRSAATVDDGPSGRLAGDAADAGGPTSTDPADLDEEVIRLVGYDTIPAALPAAPAGRGFTERAARCAAASASRWRTAGYVEAPSYPFVVRGRPRRAAAARPTTTARSALRLANPLSDEEPLLRTTLLPGLLHALRRNVGRGNNDVGAVRGRRRSSGPGADPLPAAAAPAVDRRPTDEEVAALDAALPAQPPRVAVVLAGAPRAARLVGRRPAGELGRRGRGGPDGRPRRRGVELTVRADQHAPWHPGRCAVLLVGDRVVGHAGELHPRVVASWGLPERTCAMELDLDAARRSTATRCPRRGSRRSRSRPRTSPLVVDASVPAAEVEAALRDGAGDLLESLRLFDVYRGAQVGEGKASLAYTLRFRAPDRTLTVEEVTAAREAAVAEAARRTGRGRPAA